MGVYVKGSVGPDALAKKKRATEVNRRVTRLFPHVHGRFRFRVVFFWNERKTQQQKREDVFGHIVKEKHRAEWFC